MASADEVFPTSECCEICGIELGDEVVVQEFADGSLVRLCPECAAGADLRGSGEARPKPREHRKSIWPDEQDYAAPAPTADFDPLEKTRELLMPVTDLIALQGEMQAALQRLASSLERFAAEMITDSQDKTAVEDRLQILELELDKTRAQLSQTEFLLVGAAPDGAAASAVTGAPVVAPPAAPLVAPPAGLPEVSPLTAGPAAADASAQTPGEAQTTGAAQTAGPAYAPAPDGGAVAPRQHPDQMPTFRIDEVQAAQRYYNESPFTNRVRDVRRSLGKPKANLSRLPGPEPLALVTIAWDIVWYQYLVDLHRDLPGSIERVTLHREGMDLDELAFQFREKNAVVNDDGRLDASELEVKLLSDPSALIPEMTPEDQQVFEDATEEVWDQRIAPEFKWDD